MMIISESHVTVNGVALNAYVDIVAFICNPHYKFS